MPKGSIMHSLENKIPPPIIAAVFVAAMWGLSLTGSAIELNLTASAVSMVVLLVSGALFAITGVLTFKRAETTVNPLKPETASSLVSSGVYRISRNPMYVGMALFLAAWGVYLSSALAIIGVPGFILYMNRYQIAPEERALTEIFGFEFEIYQSKVRRWL